MEIKNFVIQTFVGAIIGYFTNWLAIKMLFRPYEAKFIFGKKIPFTPGIIPKERLNLSKKISETTVDYILTTEVLKKSLISDDIKNKISVVVENLLEKYSSGLGEMNFDEAVKDKSYKIGQYLSEKLMASEDFDNIFKEIVYGLIDKNTNKITSMFMNKEKLYLTLKGSINEFICNEENRIKIVDFIVEKSEVYVFPKVKTMKVNEVINLKINEVLILVCDIFIKNINFQKIIQERIDEFSAVEMEKIVLGVINKELRAITILGGVLGFLIAVIPNIVGIFVK